MSANGCYNREPLSDTILAQDGWHDGIVIETRYPRMVTLPVEMSKHCNYSIHAQDPKCAGCKWNQVGREL